MGLYQMTSDMASTDEDSENESAKKVALKREIHKVNFTYKFVPGVSSSSLGIYVAKKAGLDSKVIDIAQRRASEFNDKLSKIVTQVSRRNEK